MHSFVITGFHNQKIYTSGKWTYTQLEHMITWQLLSPDTFDPPTHNVVYGEIHLTALGNRVLY